MAKSIHSYISIINGKLIKEKDIDFQERIKKEIVDIRILTKDLFLNSSFEIKSIEIADKNDIIIISNGFKKIALLHRPLKNSGVPNKNDKRWQVYANAKYVDNMPNYLLGSYSIGNEVIFCLFDDEVFIKNYADGDSKKSYSSSWVSFDLMKEIIDDDIIIGSNNLGKNTKGRVRVVFRKDFIDDALETLMDLEYNPEYRPVLLPTYKKRKVLDYYEVKFKPFNKKESVYTNVNGKLKIKRNPLYIKLAIENSDNKCEVCDDHFSFLKPNGKMYTEGHHLLHVNFTVQKDFKNISLDHPLNIFSLCPNCHRKIHLSNVDDRKKLIDLLYNNRKDMYLKVFDLTSSNQIYKYYNVN